MNVTNLFVNNINGVLKQTNMATGTATTGFLAFAGPAGTAAWAAPGFQPSNTNLTSIAGIPSVDGDILVFTNGGWYKLPRGSANQVLQMDSGGNYPLWGTGNTNPITGLTYDIDITTTTFGSDPISIWTNTLSTNTTLLVWNAIGVVAGPTNINSTKIERAQFHRYDSTVIDDGSNTLGSVTAIVLRTNGNTVEAIATGAAGETNNIRLRGFYLTITNGFSTTLIFTNAISPTISPNGGLLAGGSTNVTITSDGNMVYWTTNGDTPTTNLTGYASGYELTVYTTDFPLKAIAWTNDGFRLPSTVASATFTNAPAVGAPTFHWTLDEASGSFADSIGSTNVLIDSNTVTRLAGVISNAVAVASNAQQFVTTPVTSDGTAPGTNSWSLFMWVNFATTNRYQGIFSLGYGGGTQRIMHMYRNSDSSIRLGYYTNGDSTVQIATSTLKPSTNEWHLIGAMVDALNSKLIYSLDASYYTTNALARISPSTNGQLSVGKDLEFPTAYYFDGSFDDIRMYLGSVLTTNQIIGLYTNGLGL